MVLNFSIFSIQSKRADKIHILDINKNYSKIINNCLFELWLNVPLNTFSVMSEQSNCFLGIEQHNGRKCVCPRKQF